MANGIESVQASFRELNGRAPAWIRQLREEGIERFSELGFPTTRLEDWKYTSVASLAARPFRRAPRPTLDASIRSAVDGLRVAGATEVVFVNGHFVRELSSPAGSGDGVSVSSLAEAFDREPDLVRAHLGRHCDLREEAFTALNTAFLEDGAFVRAPRGIAPGAPVHLLFLTVGSGEAPMSSPRVLAVAEEGSSLVLVESHAGIGPSAYFTNAVTEIAVGPGASVSHCKIQREGDGAAHIATVVARQEASSRFVSQSVSLGAALARNGIGAILDAEGAECSLDGLYMVQGRQHVDHHTTIDHRKPHGSSRELYKGVLDGQSTGVFNGKVYVRPDAQKSDAQQVNKNLLLSEAATINTKPQLEIFADDVKCSHGATIGRLDEKALFYLRSRGIGESAARDLLIYAFANELVGRIAIEPVRAQLERVLASRLRAAPLEETGS